MNTINIGSVGLIPVSSGLDPNVTLGSGTVSGSMSVPCSVGEAVVQQQSNLPAPPQHIQIPGTAMSIGSLAVAMGLSGAGADPNNLAFTSNALAHLSARMGMSSMAGTNPAGLVATGNSLVTFPGNAAINIMPGVGMAPAGVSIVDGSGLNMTVAGGMAMQAPPHINVVGVQTSADMAGSIGSQQQGHAGGALLQNNVHINAGGSLVNNIGGALGGGGGGAGGSAHSSGSCCGGCKNRVTVKDQSAQTDLSTVMQVKAEERLARSGLMPGARLISNSQGTTISHANPNSHHGPNFPCSCDFCGRMFAKKEYLRRHIRIHTGERPYKCVICGHSFRRSHHLRRHEMTHTGEKPYACTECGKAFTRKQHLDRHYKTHTGEYHRTFKCPFCEKMFFRAHHRDKHMKRHVGNMNLTVRPDGSLKAEGLSSSPHSVTSRENSHSSEDYLTSDEEEGKAASANKPKEGSKKRKGTSPMRLRFPYDYNLKDGSEGMKVPGMDITLMKNMVFPMSQPGPSHGASYSSQPNTILTTPTRGRPKGSKNKVSGAMRSKKKAERDQVMNHLVLDMKSSRMDLDRDGYVGVGAIKKDEDMIGNGVYAGKTISNMPQQFVSEAVVVRHSLQGGSPHTLVQQQQMMGLGGEKTVKDEAGSVHAPTPTATPTPDGRGQQMQWQHQHQQQVGINPGGGSVNGPDYMSNLSRQLQPAVSAQGPTTPGNSNIAPGDVQQTMHYKPPNTPDQNLHHSWTTAGAWPRLPMGSEPNVYAQADASRFMNVYGAAKIMEMRMTDVHNQQTFDGNQWNQGRREQVPEKGDNRVYSMHQ